jgi:serine/threonine protein phosphatase 1
MQRMLNTIRQLWSATGAQPLPAVPEGQRVYAVGDVHGRLDLLTALATAIDADDAARGDAETTVVLLGDLIDRGPDSAGVLAFLRDWRGRRALRFILGNHEEIFLRSFVDPAVFRNFLLYGGRETILSFPVDARAFQAADLDAAQALMAAAVPREDIAFIEGFENFAVFGDYLFVHAGIQPGEPLTDQNAETMRWIREPFLSYAGRHEHVVVHGHTIAAEADLGRNRIGIDTGAYASGRLTALGLEGESRWLIETADSDGESRVATRRP